MKGLTVHTILGMAGSGFLFIFVGGCCIVDLDVWPSCSLLLFNALSASEKEYWSQLAKKKNEAIREEVERVQKLLQEYGKVGPLN